MVGDILQPTHLIFILVVALLVLGPKRLPEVGKSLGRGIRDFKDALTTDDRHEHDEIATSASAPVTSAPAAAAAGIPAIPAEAAPEPPKPAGS